MASKSTLLSHSKSKDTILMNVGTHVDASPNNIMTDWLYPCICTHGHTIALPNLNHKLNIIITKNHCSLHHTKDKLYFIKFTFCKDHDLTTTIQCKQLKYQTLADTLEDSRWYITLTILTTSICNNIHQNI